MTTPALTAELELYNCLSLRQINRHVLAPATSLTSVLLATTLAPAAEEAPAFRSTPKRRDLSKPSYRSQALHNALKSPLRPAPGAAAAAAEAAAAAAAAIKAGGVQRAAAAKQVRVQQWGTAAVELM